MDEAVRCWRQTGRLYFWREARKTQGEGWHLAAEADGLRDLRAIITLCRSALHPARFALGVPSSSQNVGPAELVLSHNQTWAPDHWILSPRGLSAVLELGSDRLTELEAAIGDMEGGRGDFTIGGEEEAERIWIWWPPR
ncbi:hypothetical protein GCM10007859_24510 [Brevundimonas denitrificans]|uniref:Uncharacterized protein n=1 Tax=Brevundimonas denitrificans TaxID=1443434 RepID=A0ABQ6BLS4_9CAUL|nr:hypothetical protein [Brevundimonas denitrificans]GLS02427.1 hypothetical protein GCM10007859_24510 [Brevundimonas denitrificans]